MYPTATPADTAISQALTPLDETPSSVGRSGSYVGTRMCEIADGRTIDHFRPKGRAVRRICIVIASEQALELDVVDWGEPAWTVGTSPVLAAAR